MSHSITVRLDEELASWLEKTAQQTGLSQGQVVRNQLVMAKAANANRAFMKLAGTVRGLPRNLSSRKGFSRS